METLQAVTELPVPRPLKRASDIPEELLGTPFEKMIRYHNLEEELPPVDDTTKPEMLIIKCMDHRKSMRLPERFAYIVRNAGGNARSNEFSMAFAIGVGQVKHVALISHTDCGMIRLGEKKDRFIEGMVQNAGWSEERAEQFFQTQAGEFGMLNPVTFILAESLRFQTSYPSIHFQSFLYNVEDNQIYLVK